MFNDYIILLCIRQLIFIKEPKSILHTPKHSIVELFKLLDSQIVWEISPFVFSPEDKSRNTYHLRHSVLPRGPLTLVVDEEANISPAAVSGEEQVHIVACTDEELRCLRAMVLSDQWG